MITGTVNARLEATIHIPVRDAAGLDHTIESVIDTGFSGSLTLPSSVIAAFGLPWRSRGTAVLANGAVDHFDIQNDRRLARLPELSAEREMQRMSQIREQSFAIREFDHR